MNYPKKKFEDIALFINGRAFKPSEWKDNGLPIIRIQNLTDAEKTFNYFDGKPEDKYLVKNGDLLISWSASLGVFIWDRGDAVLNQHIFKVKLNDNLVDKKYFFYAASNILNVMKSRVHGATMKHITKDRFEDLEVAIPSFGIQRKIASILEKAESAKQKRQEANRLTDEFLKSAFIEMFGDPISNTKRWEHGKLGEALDVRDGTHDTPKYIAKGIPLITSKNLKDGKIDFDNVFYISQADYEQIIKRSFVETGDILYGMIGTIGSPVVVNTDRKFGIKNVALFKFRGRKVNNYYIKTLFEDDFLTKKLLSEKRGGNQKFVSLDILRNFNIPLPPFELQQEFAALVQKVEALKSKQQESAKELDNLSNSLMQKAFRGELYA